ncbi:trehalase family glycosidase [Actinoplanes sp. KI2]|uniref:MGH1-like glycoside hydrolase domain-containing protein n=1 Tax=Actinoplanes sp. KI2 TaxID=2983315 RepID=UPI0021D59236|nr:trehalase family glycosidase [Actinoplanes sp. KI2]MCU7730930.1 trehalase family glycosidase [Actinoplanes sp. KI2]
MHHDLIPNTAPKTEISAELWNSAVRVLETNWAGDHMVPSRRLYPHQWSWDAAFIAIGLAYVNPTRAWRDLRSLFEAQWPDGRVPHIVFDPATAEADYFPGPGFWDVPAYGDRPARGSTGIVQPPMHAIAAWEVYRHAAAHGADCGRQARTELEWLYPRLVAQQRYLTGERNLGGGGLAAIVHPWESGLDNSPAWDEAMANVPADLGLLTTYRRRDLEVSDAAHRPTDVDYSRYVGLVLTYRAEGYSDDGLLGRHAFVVECPSFNSILATAELALAQIAGELGLAAEARTHRERARAITAAIVQRLWNPQTRTFHALDVRTGRLSPERCVSGLVPLMLPDLAAEQVEAVMAEARSDRFGISDLPAPSYDRTAPAFDTRRYWRGPLWINVNWLLRRGLLMHGFHDEAEDLRTAMVRLVHRNGHFEYFHPITGEGLGAPTFSWTAALSLDLLADRSVPAYARAA